MMTHAYADTYLNDAMNNLGDMLDYAVCDCNYDADTFFSLFVSSGVATEFESGNPKFVAGMSGPELASEVIYRAFGKGLIVKPSENTDKSPEYWAGWALAYYQWYSGLRFSQIHKALTFSELLRLYPTLHEADISKFVEVAGQIIRRKKEDTETNLSRLRKARGFSQKELSRASGVSMRMIQLYEQRRNDINKAQVGALLSLSKALGCKMEDLMELIL